MDAITLPYANNALNAIISEQTINYHFGKHYQTYIANLNKLIVGTPFEKEGLIDIVKKSEGAIFNNASQAWNHEFYFKQFIATSSSTPTPLKELATAIDKQWGSFENFKKEFSDAAVSIFGSGWAWLAKDNNSNLSILKESNAGTPLTKGLIPILTFDVWEHAYYLDYQNKRADHVAALWNILNWEILETRFTAY